MDTQVPIWAAIVCANVYFAAGSPFGWVWLGLSCLFQLFDLFRKDD